MLQWFNNRKIASRIFVVFAAVLALNVIGGEFGLKKLMMAHESEHDATSVQAPLQTLDEMRSSLNSHNRAQFEYLAARNDKERLESTETFGAAHEAIQQSKEKYGTFMGNGIATSEEERAFSEFKEDLARYLALSRESMERGNLQRASTQGTSIDRSRIARYEGRRRRAKPAPGVRPSPEAQDLLFGEEKNALTASVSDLRALATLRIQSEQASSRASAALYSSSEQQVQIEIAFCFAAGLILALAIGRNIARPIEHLVIATRHIGGDLGGAPIEMDPRDEAGELAKHVDGMQRNFNQMMETVANCARRITAAGAATEISGLAAELQDLASHFQFSTPLLKAAPDKPVRSAEWGQLDAAVESANGYPASALTLAPQPTPRPGVARIHARLLESGAKPEPQRPGPSSASAARPG
jgi:methyl-accepting chemotaxis protein